MTGRERLAVAMSLGSPDRVPVMCQLALGHYFLNTEFGAVDIWHDTRAFGEALLTLQRRYGFDGILVNLPGRDPNWREQSWAIEHREDETIVRWRGGGYTVCPGDDNPHVYTSGGLRYFPRFDDVDPARLYYVEPHDIGGISYPQRWGFDSAPAIPGRDFFPSWHFDTIHYVREHAPDVSLHAEVFSPFSQMIELLDYTSGFLALHDDPGKFKACLEALTEGAIELACGQAAAGADAILISSAFAGAGFISRQHYSEFVLPYEQRVIAGVRARVAVPIYTHTCGAIGDRLDLMFATGTNGIDTLDPPPLGTVELADAKRQLAGRLFLKGNLDPVNTLLLGSVEEVRAAARERLRIGAPGGGYILSSACSVAPATPPENIAVLREVADEAAAVGGA